MDTGRRQTRVTTARAEWGSRQRGALMSGGNPASIRGIDRRLSTPTFLSRALGTLRWQASPSTRDARHQNQKIGCHDRKNPNEHSKSRGGHKGPPSSNTQERDSQQANSEKQNSPAEVGKKLNGNRCSRGGVTGTKSVLDHLVVGNICAFGAIVVASLRRCWRWRGFFGLEPFFLRWQSLAMCTRLLQKWQVMVEWMRGQLSPKRQWPRRNCGRLLCLRGGHGWGQ